MDQPPPDLRPLLSRVVDRLLHRDPPCKEHCRCVEGVRVKVGIMFAVFIVVVGALVRREVLSYVPRTEPAPEPVRSGYVLPGADGVKNAP